MGDINLSMEAAGVQEKKKNWAAEGLLLPVSMVLVQVFTMGALLLSKVVFNIGMQPFVLLAYRNLIGTITILPFAFYFEWEMIKRVNLKILGWITVNAFFGIVLAMGLHYYGLRTTNAAYAVNFLNLIPIITFIIGIILRVEKLKITTRPGKMKVVGTVISVGGTMVISLYKGKVLHLWPTHLLKSQLQAAGAASSPLSHHSMLIGTLFLCGSCFSYAFWFTIQVRVAKVFPSKYFSSMLACVLGTVQAVLIGIVLDRDLSSWALKWDLQLLTIVYSGVFNTGITFCLISWAVARRGPTYPSMFNSLSLIVTMALDSLLLGTNLSVGSLLGATLIIVGLYAFLWGKGKEMQQQQISTATNTDLSKGGTTMNNCMENEQVGNHETRIRLEVN